MGHRDQPRIVLITGAPGSGKSVLGSELSRALRIPRIARDDVRGGLFFTQGAWTDRPRGVPSPDDAVETLLSAVESLVRAGVSLVVEYVVRQDRLQDLARLGAGADCVVLVTGCANASSRLVRRESADRLLNRRPVLDALGFPTIDDHARDAVARAARVTAAMQTEFDLPTLHVTTDDGFAPDLDEIIEFVTADRHR